MLEGQAGTVFEVGTWDSSSCGALTYINHYPKGFEAEVFMWAR